MKRPRALCEQCGAVESRYTCPRCGVVTCSLACCRQHKVETECNGQRNKTAFVNVREFDTRTLRSDLSLLSDIARSADSARRDNARAFGDAPSTLGGLPRRAKRGKGRRGGAAAPALAPTLEQQLARAASARGIELLRMPLGMTRRDANTSSYDAGVDHIAWRVEWVFVVADESIDVTDTAASRTSIGSNGKQREYRTVTLVESALSEETSLRDALAALLVPDPSKAALQYRLRRHRLCAVEELTLFLKRELVAASSASGKYARLPWQTPAAEACGEGGARRALAAERAAGDAVGGALGEAESGVAGGAPAEAGARAEDSGGAPCPTTLRIALKKRVVLEFPMIYVALPSQCHLFGDAL